MTRMMKHVARWPLLSVVLAVAMVGCGPDPKEKKINELSSEIEGLKNDLADRDRQLNDSLVRDNDSRDTIDQLNREMAKLRAGGGPAKDTEGWVSTANFDMMSLADSVLFESGKAALTNAGRAKLKQVATEIKSRFGDRDIYIFGHTDAQPIKKSGWKDNWELSAQRSLTVVRTLHECGVPYNQLISASCAEYRPIVQDAAKKDQPRNRRVEFFAVRKGAGTQGNTVTRGPAEE